MKSIPNSSTGQPARTSRRALVKATAAVTGASALGFPMISRAQAKPIKVGMPTILSGRVAQLGTSARNGVMMEVEKFNAAGGLGGRPIEMVIRDSKGTPQEAARVSRELINSDGCEVLFDCEASSGAFAVHEVARDLGVLCIHNLSETSSLSADPKLRIPNAFRVARQGIFERTQILRVEVVGFEFERQHGKVLPQRVVDIAGDAGTLGILAVQQLPRALQDIVIFGRGGHV